MGIKSFNHEDVPEYQHNVYFGGAYVDKNGNKLYLRDKDEEKMSYDIALNCLEARIKEINKQIADIEEEIKSTNDSRVKSKRNNLQSQKQNLEKQKQELEKQGSLDEYIIDVLAGLNQKLIHMQITYKRLVAQKEGNDR